MQNDSLIRPIKNVFGGTKATRYVQVFRLLQSRYIALKAFFWSQLSQDYRLLAPDMFQNTNIIINDNLNANHFRNFR